MAEKRWEYVGLLRRASSQMFSSNGRRGLETEMGFGCCCGGGGGDGRDGFVKALMKWGFGKWGFGDGVLGLMEKKEEIDEEEEQE